MSPSTFSDPSLLPDLVTTLEASLLLPLPTSSLATSLATRFFARSDA